ncbi:MAG: Zn-dependent hydrolase [Desulfovibrio sp.]|jgi:N-carbamoyl-L-amino-acid hydrolase|nr:Zn-dependent hydrolase [Desulfovibrio sp.]
MRRTSKERLTEKLACFGRFGADERGGITRLSLSPAALEACGEFRRRCECLGLAVRCDDMGNIYAVKRGTEDLPGPAMGSHADSVVNGGNYDGMLGVLAALEVLETMVLDGISTRRPVSAVIWTNEEGVRFPPAMMSSGVLTGKFDKAAVLDVRDADGVSFGEALSAAGRQGDKAARLGPESCTAYLELHIEQGPVLYESGESIGVVQGVVGMCNYTVSVFGRAGHAGSTPMPRRRDALYAAAGIIRRLHDDLGSIAGGPLFTFGHIECRPNMHTIIPEEVSFSLDARHRDPDVVRRVVEVITSLPKESDGCRVEYREEWARRSTLFDPALTALVKRNADALGYAGRFMFSGPGHDAQYVQDMLPAAMIFVPSIGGLSHCPDEKTSLDDCRNGTDVLLNTVLELADT